MPETKQSFQTKGQPVKWLLIALGGAFIICLLCVGVTILPTAGFFASAFFSPTSTPFAVTSRIANQILTIRQMQNGQVVLNDPRFVSLDQAGNIYVGNNEDGNISIFDPSGTLLRSIHVIDDLTMRGMAVAPDGTIYLSYDGNLHRLDSQGKPVTLPYDSNATTTSYLKNITIEKDGSLLAADDSGNILRFAKDGTISVVVRTPFKTYIKDSEAEYDLALAVDGAGNIYVLGRDSWHVLKLSPTGEYLSDFGGKTHNHANSHPDMPTAYAVPFVDPGFFFFPEAIAVDAYGRILVSDGTFNVQVFDAKETFVSSFMVPDDVMGMTFDPAGDLYLTGDTPQLLKLDMQAP